MASLLMGGCARPEASLEEERLAGQPVWHVAIGGGADDAYVGFGWSRPDRYGPVRMRWTTELDADVAVHLSGEGTPYAVEIEAIAPVLNWRDQRMALFVNHRYVMEWVFHRDPVWMTCRALVPAHYWREGPNVITLRAAYRTRIGRDSRSLALGVQRLALYAMGQEEVAP